MFDGFHEARVPVGDAEIFALTGGAGPPLLLLHGFPQNHVMWHLVAPRLAARFSVVIPDLRGYGDSRGLIGLDPDFYLWHLLNRWAGRADALEPDAIAEYARHFRKPSVVEAVCEDYRAGATVDADDDRADRASGRKIECPVLVLWGRQYLSAKAAATSPLEVWQRWADEVRDVALDCGHFLAEEQPDACAEALERFFAGSPRG